MWDRVVGQDRAVEMLRRFASRPLHAYLLVGPAGSGIDDAARAFAASLIGVADDARAAELVARGVHPDVVEIEPATTVVSVDQVRELVVEAANVPVEADRKVIVLFGAQRLNDQAANALLKTLEEPPSRAVIVLVTDSPDGLPETVRSRCQQVDFALLAEDVIRGALQAQGLEPATAERAARLAGGSLGRARLLAGDYSNLRAAFADAPAHADGTGAGALRLAERLGAAVEDALGAVKAEHEGELDSLDARLDAAGYVDRTANRLRQRRREQLRLRERSARREAMMEGLVALESVYRDTLAGGIVARNLDRPVLPVDPNAAARALEVIAEARRAFEFNPNEALLLEWVMLSLPPAPSTAARADATDR